ncbi:MAG: NYN domain-containing protein [Anaerolineales bacterium]|nr:NYN domain-containing protein [Anaerolineales bacterium]
MPYIIDGHNLIPHISGINLSDLDDEIKLIQSLQKFANKRRSKIEVFFDRASTTRSHSQNLGLVKAVFVQQESTADNAIKSRLSQLGKGAKNWTVVSSDREIRVEARSYQSKTLTSPEFARLLRDQLSEIQKEGEDPDSPDQSNLEVDYWLDQFSQE